MYEIEIILSEALKNTPVVDYWVVGGVLVSAGICIITAVGLILTWRINYLNEKRKQSLFYLEEIKSYFSNATSLLSTGTNNNVHWHQAIESLKTAESLKEYLTEKPHQHIYLTCFSNVAFELVDIIKDIDDFKFFFGIENYVTETLSALFEKSNPVSLIGKPRYRIAPEALSCLCNFIKKANQVFYDDNYKNEHWENIFSSKYFNASIKDKIDLTEFSGYSGTKIIIDYIKEFRRQENNRVNEQMRRSEEPVE